MNDPGDSFGVHLFFFKVLCFSPCSTIFSRTLSPFFFLTAFMYFLATLSVSAFSPKWSSSSSVEGTQKGSLGITWNNTATSLNILPRTQ